MSSFVEPSRSRAVSRLALMAALAAGLAGCSSDFSRFERALGLASRRPRNDVTGSVKHRSRASRADPQGRDLARFRLRPTAAAPASAAISRRARQEVTGSVQSSSHPRQPAPPPQNWSWDGGTAIVVAQGETIDIDLAPPWRAAARDPAGEQHDAMRRSSSPASGW